MAIETALVAPMVILLALSSADFSKIISRQQELQSAMGQVEGIALASNSGATTDTATLKTLLMQSLSLPSSNVVVEKLYRCGTNATLVADSTSCSSSDVVSSYIKVTLLDSYNPIWQRVSKIGTWNFSVQRTVQLS
ncbi:pilus assembly protein [Novosphingobium sp. G106]|uniref:TadE/TadG family type IV pilus assembly protein n=1 Tax=Novosphingobium sp. G106 TaxID=2849500 RepID=UPI001C2D2F68|nr:TadE/TadG family type IV pilus assembly protein [Novosphingobium sp. G106]MBV1689358.1 pilus assembly protein [Novosphingobium sp. G106]